MTNILADIKFEGGGTKIRLTILGQGTIFWTAP